MNDDEVNNIGVIEGRALIDLATDEQPINGDRVYASHPWNQVIPRPLPLPAPPMLNYRLTVQHNHEKYGDSGVPCSAVAICHSREQLLDLNAQFEEIDYHFVKLELIEAE